MAVTEEQVREQLTKVIDPELFVNIVDLGLIYVIDLEEVEGGAATAACSETAEAPPVADPVTAAEAPTDEQAAPTSPAEECSAAPGPQTNVKIEMTMTSPMCPAGPQLVANSKQVVGQLEGVGEVEVKVVMDPPWTPDRMTDDAKDKLGIF